jgi:DNA (cytosine-5)-methyltransferase 1
MSARDFLLVKQAAVLLQVAPNTIRSWGATGKIPEYRHPVNGYRLYRKVDLEKVVQKLERLSPQPVKKRRPRPR